MTHAGKRRVIIDQVPQRVWRAAGLPFGLLTRQINADPETGAQTLVVDVPPGWHMPAHWNAADLELLVRDGDLTIAGRECRPGHYLFLPSGTELGPISSEHGATLIFWTDSPFEVRTDTPPAPSTPLGETVDIFDKANWRPVREAFAGVTDTSSHGDLEVPTQCIRLRKVEESGKDTILFVLPRRFTKTALEFHHSTEEIFFLGGWCATDPEHVYHAGEYLCWEPGVIHGVVTGWEAICLSKHHGPLTSPQIPLGATSLDAER
ncbi:cupin domain-containing protein [Micromonospora sp. NPDC003241]